MTCGNCDDQSPVIRKRLKWVGFLLPGATLFLLPKCPACLAAYIAVGTGLSMSIPAASGLQAILIGLSVGSLLWLVVTNPGLRKGLVADVEATISAACLRSGA
jgi:hypothetical protein